MFDLVSEGLLVVDVLSKALTDTLELSDVVTDFLDGLHLLLKVLRLNEVAQLWGARERERES